MKIFVAVVVILVMAAGGFMIAHKVSPLSWGWWGTTNTSDGIALSGYDPVSYFESETPQLGTSEFTYEWRDAIWRFSSAENEALFATNPERYAPQFGGFCAFAVSKGVTAEASSDAWHIEGDKLYVFADDKVRKTWVGGIEDGILHKSEENWAKR